MAIYCGVDFHARQQTVCSAVNKTFAVDPLVRNEKRVGLKNLQVVNIPPSTSIWTPLNFYSVVAGASTVIRLLGAGAGGAPKETVRRSSSLRCPGSPHGGRRP